MKQLTRWFMHFVVAVALTSPLAMVSESVHANKNMPDWISDGGDFDQVVSSKSKKVVEMVVMVGYAILGIFFFIGAVQFGMSRPESGILKMVLSVVSGILLTSGSIFFGLWS